MKRCTKCGEVKPLDEFYVSSASASGRTSDCKVCRRTYARNLQREKREFYRILERTRRNTPEGRAHKTALDKKYDLKWPIKNKARQKVRYAIRKGLLTRLPCQECGADISQAHHDDYTRPLDVLWLCPIHHGAHHVFLREVGCDPDALLKEAA